MKIKESIDQIKFMHSMKKNQKAACKLLEEIEREACDRVWLDRSDIGTEHEPEGISENIRQRALVERKRIMKEYEINPEDCDDFYHGYWSGILALCRFLGGVSEPDINSIRNRDELLDTNIFCLPIYSLLYPYRIK